MKKSDLILELAKRGNVNKETARSLLNNMTDIITEALKSNEIVKIDGLGRFYNVIYRDHNIRAINGSKMALEARLSPRFKASKSLKEAVKNNE